jgi:hypothetical protein
VLQIDNAIDKIMEDCDTINWFIHVLPLEIQLFRGEDCDTINWFTPPIQALDF